MANLLYAPFFSATRDVFNLMLDLNITNEPLEGGQSSSADSNINIAIGIIGDMQGQVIYRFPVETSLEMVKIMSGMEIEEIDEFVTSAMGEIANIISGNVTTILSEQEIICDILPPQILMQDEQKEQMDEYTYQTSSKIRTDIGDIILDIMLKTQ